MAGYTHTRHLYIPGTYPFQSPIHSIPLPNPGPTFFMPHKTPRHSRYQTIPDPHPFPGPHPFQGPIPIPVPFHSMPQPIPYNYLFQTPPIPSPPFQATRAILGCQIFQTQPIPAPSHSRLHEPFQAARYSRPNPCYLNT